MSVVKPSQEFIGFFIWSYLVASLIFTKNIDMSKCCLPRVFQLGKSFPRPLHSSISNFNSRLQDDPKDGHKKKRKHSRSRSKSRHRSRTRSRSKGRRSRSHSHSRSKHRSRTRSRSRSHSPKRHRRRSRSRDKYYRRRRSHSKEKKSKKRSEKDEKPTKETPPAPTPELVENVEKEVPKEDPKPTFERFKPSFAEVLRTPEPSKPKQVEEKAPKFTDKPVIDLPINAVPAVPVALVEKTREVIPVSGYIPDSVRKDQVNYVYFDPEIHWCRVCNVFPKTAKEYLLHLHATEHKQTLAVSFTRRFMYKYVCVFLHFRRHSNKFYVLGFQGFDFSFSTKPFVQLADVRTRYVN